MAKKVFIGVGHGGNDPGAVGYLVEKDVNLTMACACKESLEDNGVIVRMSRTRDENDDLREEIREANAFAPDLAIDIHNNAGRGDGIEVYHKIAGGVSKTLAQNLETEIKALGQNSRGVKTKTNSLGRDYFGFIRQIKAPAVLAEGVFVDNANDVKIADTIAEQKEFGYAYARAILKTLGITPGANKPTRPQKPTASFFPPRGYFMRGDNSPNIGKIASFMRRVFPSYTSEKALGNYYGDNIIKAVKEFQRRTGLKPDGFFGPLTLEKLKTFGFKA